MRKVIVGNLDKTDSLNKPTTLLSVSVSLSEIGATGLEPVTTNSQTLNNKEFTGYPKASTVQKLAKSGNSDIKGMKENDKDLQQIVTVWQDLPEHIKAAIRALIETHTKGQK